MAVRQARRGARSTKGRRPDRCFVSGVASRVLRLTGGAMTHPIQHIGGTILLVMMDVEEGHEAEFDRWYNEEHLPERMEIPGYVSARRFKLEEGNGVLKYLCIWEMEDGSPLQSEMYKSQRARPSWIREEANKYITQRARGLYKQIYPAEGAFEDHSGS